jgi:3-isopropylmalate dehydrogenase
MAESTVVLLPGDGVGPEVTQEAAACLELVAPDIRLVEHPIGGAALDAEGEPLPQTTLAACVEADAVFLGAVGGPRYEGVPETLRPERGLLRLRQALGAWANLRPVRVHPDLTHCSPLRPERVRGADVLIVRELLGGIYFGEPRSISEGADGRRAIDTMEYTEGQIRRVAVLAFDLARQRRSRVLSVDKANVLACSRLWRSVVDEVAADFRDVDCEHGLVDACTLRLLTDAPDLDVVLCGNLFGDILSDEAAVLCGSLGMLPSASIGDGEGALFEPVHGSAPDLAGTGQANPVGAILSAAMLLRHGLGRPQQARCVEAAVDATLAEGTATPDVGGTASTRQFGSEVRRRLLQSGPNGEPDQ